MRTLAISDIHGCNREFNLLLDKVGLNKDDKLIILGDLIDRGPDSKDVVETFLKLVDDGFKVVPLLGNHELMMINSVLHETDINLWINNGGGFTLKSYNPDWNKEDTLIRFHAELFESFSLYYEDEKFLYVHAGIDPYYSLTRQTEDDILWIRRKFIESTKDFGKIVVFGHTVMEEPLVQANKIGIDTGGVFGGAFTCVELPEIKFYQVPKQAAWNDHRNAI